jgi:hypothetical protein
MAKLAFTKISKVKSLPTQSYSFGEETIEVEQYLPLNDKITLIENVIELAGDEVGFFNIVKLEAYYRIYMIKNYTNITFTEKQMEDITKLYDLIELNGVWKAIESMIPEKERTYIWNNILELAQRITDYNNSVLGILKTVGQDYGENENKVNDLLFKLTDSEAFELVKQIGPLV